MNLRSGHPVAPLCCWIVTDGDRREQLPLRSGGRRVGDGSGGGLQVLAASGYVLAVITNQSGIARGRFGWAQTEMVNARVAALLKTAGVDIAGWFVCPHGPADGCACRKPRAVWLWRGSRSRIGSIAQLDRRDKQSTSRRLMRLARGRANADRPWGIMQHGRGRGPPGRGDSSRCAVLILKTDAARVPERSAPSFRRGNVRPPARPTPR
ncbi:HAD-IIIA family hydrolase [Sphingomonas melonis]|uniref:HAD-IIIA family hydrolase n=1 Tax=Sphingomonas melonis TaxID=152682 RepID=UPI0009F205DC